MPLFAAVATRYKGQPIPPSEQFRNVLEREFEIDVTRVPAAELRLMDSARDSGVLVASGGNQFLSIEGVAAPNTAAIEPLIHGAPHETLNGPEPEVSQPSGQPAVAAVSSPTPTGSLIISEQDVAELSDGDFDEVWNALGKVFRARGKRQMRQQDFDHRDKDSQSTDGTE